MQDYSFSQQEDAAKGLPPPPDASCPEPPDRLAAARGFLLGLGIGLALWMAGVAAVLAWLHWT